MVCPFMYFRWGQFTLALCAAVLFLEDRPVRGTEAGLPSHEVVTHPEDVQTEMSSHVSEAAPPLPLLPSALPGSGTIADTSVTLEPALKEEGPTVSALVKEESWESYKLPEALGEAGSKGTSLSIKDIIETTNDYTYASFGKPNPFVPPLISTFMATMEIPIVSVLQKYALNQLVVSGIWQLENGERKALVITPQEEGVTTAIGDPIGRRGGKVIKIDAQSMKVREFSMAPDGTRQFEDFELILGGEQPKEEDKIILKASRPGLVEHNALGKDYLESSDQEARRRSLHFQQLQEADTQNKALNDTGKEIDDVEKTIRDLKKEQATLPKTPATPQLDPASTP